MVDVTIPGVLGNLTIPYTTTQAAALVQIIENNLAALINEGSVTPGSYQGVQGTSASASSALGPVLKYALLDGDQLTTFDQANTPYINVVNEGYTFISNTQSVQTVVSGSTGGLGYYAANTGHGTTPGAVVWVSGGFNTFTVGVGATAQFNIDTGRDIFARNIINAQDGTSTVTLFSGYTQLFGGFYTPPAFGDIPGVTGESTITIGGTDSVATLIYHVGNTGGTVTSLGKASIALDDPSYGTSAVFGSTTVPLGDVVINASGEANWLDAGGTSPTVNLSSGSLLLTSTTPSNVVINPSGNVTIWGGLPDGSGGYAPNSGQGFLTVNPGPGSVTLFGGNSGGLVYGGNAGHNLLLAGDYSVPSGSSPGGYETSTLIGGGNADTLWAGTNGDNLLVASYGNTTLVGAISNTGDYFSLSQVALGTNPSVVGADSVLGSTHDDWYWLGSGNATIQTFGGADTFIDKGTQAIQAGAVVDVQGFTIGQGGLVLDNGVTISNTDTATSAGSTILTLSDGLKIKFEGVSDSNGQHFLKP